MTDAIPRLPDYLRHIIEAVIADGVESWPPARRREGWTPPKPPLDRGYWKFYIDHVLWADTGADLVFLVGKSGTPVLRERH